MDSDAEKGLTGLLQFCNEESKAAAVTKPGSSRVKGQAHL